MRKRERERDDSNKYRLRAIQISEIRDKKEQTGEERKYHQVVVTGE